MVYRLKLMSLVWLCVWNMIGWLVICWHEIDMHDNSMVGWWSMAMVWLWCNSRNHLVRFMVVLCVMDVIPWPSWWELMVVPHIMDIIPWPSWLELMVVPQVMDVIPWPSWWEFMVVPHTMDVILWPSWWELMVVPQVIDVISWTS